MNAMAMNYNKLWKLLIDRNLIKKDLREMAGLSTNVIAKMGKGGDVSTEVLRKICKALELTEPVYFTFYNIGNSIRKNN